MYGIRRARKSDNQVLIELEQQSLLDLGQKLVCIEHGPDFFNQSRLHLHPHFLVVEEKGRLVADYGFLPGRAGDLAVLLR